MARKGVRSINSGLESDWARANTSTGTDGDNAKASIHLRLGNRLTDDLRI